MFLFKNQLYLNLIALISFLASLLINRNRRFHPTGVKRILIVRPDRLGDLIVSLPVVDLIIEYFPKAEVTLAISSRWLSLLTDEWRYKLITYGSYEHGPRTLSLQQMKSCFHKVWQWRGKYDLILDLRGDLATVFLSPFLKLKYRVDWGTVRCEEKMKRWFFRNREKSLASGEGASIEKKGEGFFEKFRYYSYTLHWDKPYADTILGTLRYLDVQPVKRAPHVYINELRVSQARESLITQGWNGQPFVWLHPGSGTVARPGSSPHEKLWPVNYFIRLAASLCDRGYMTFFLLDPSEGTDLKMALQNEKTLCTNDLATVAAYLCLGDLFIGHDTGTTHLAAAVGCPTFSLFGPTNPYYFVPRGKTHHFIIAPNKQMSRLQVESVLKKALEILPPFKEGA